MNENKEPVKSATITYRPGKGGPSHTTWNGIEMEAGKPVEVKNNPGMIEKATNNRFFEVSGAKDQAMPEGKPTPPVVIPPDIDKKFPDERIALATAISGKTVTTVAEADQIIKDEVARRAGPKDKPALKPVNR